MTKKNEMKWKIKSNDIAESHVHQQLSACNQFALESICSQEYTMLLLSTYSVQKQICNMTAVDRRQLHWNGVTTARRSDNSNSWNLIPESAKTQLPLSLCIVAIILAKLGVSAQTLWLGLDQSTRSLFIRCVILFVVWRRLVNAYTCIVYYSVLHRAML